MAGSASALQLLAPSASSSRRPLALNRAAAVGLAEIMGTNLGPKGSVKMLVGGAGQLKLSKDGNVLLTEMAIQHPTAMMIARAATAQDDVTGDGTTSVCVVIAEILKRAEDLSSVHPRIVVDGILAAREIALKELDALRIPDLSRPTLLALAHTSLATKLPEAAAGPLAAALVDAVEIVKPGGMDLHMVEVIHMRHRDALETQLIKGLVLDHGARHAGMPRSLRNAFVLTLNVSLEYEKTEVNAGFYYSTAEQKVALAASERKTVDERVARIIQLKNQVCVGDDKDAGFLVVNQKGIDLPALDSLAAAGIMALRRAKRRNMERLALACGGGAVFDLDGLSPADLGRAGTVVEHSIGEEKYVIVDDVATPKSCTILIKGAHEHTIAQIKDAVRDGLRAVVNAHKDGCVLPGAGAVEIAASSKLKIQVTTGGVGKKVHGMSVFAEALAAIPRLLARNAGLDGDDCLQRGLDAWVSGGAKAAVGIDLASGAVMEPAARGVFDNYAVKRQMITSAAAIAAQLLMVDEILKAGALGRG